MLTVRARAAGRVEALLTAQDAQAQVVRSPGRVSFRVDLGGATADEHPWAASLARDVASLGDEVVAVRVP